MAAIASGDAGKRVADRANILADTANGAANGIATRQRQRCADQQCDHRQVLDPASRHVPRPIIKHQPKVHKYIDNIDL